MTYPQDRVFSLEGNSEGLLLQPCRCPELRVLLCNGKLPLKQSPSLEPATRHEVLRALTCQRRAQLGWSYLPPTGVQKAR